MSDRYAKGGELLEATLASMIDRLREKGAKGTPVLFMRERQFRALAGTVQMDTEPSCLIIQGEPIAVAFDESIPEEKLEGVNGFQSDILIRFLESAHDD